MKLVTLLTFSAVLYVAGAIALLFGIATIPEGIGFFAGRSSDIETVILSAALTGLGCVNWALRPSGDLGARKAITFGNFTFHSVATLAILRLLVTGTLNEVGIGLFSAHALLSVAYGYIMFVRRSYCEVRFD